jgi:hypothetical protein
MEYVLQAQEAKNIFQKVQTKYRPIYYFSKMYKNMIIQFTIHSFIFLSFPTWNIGPLSGFLWSHIQLDTR